MSRISIRKAKIEDLPVIQKLSNTLGEQSHSFDNELGLMWANTKVGEKYYRERIAEQKGVCFVAEKEGEISGFISASIHEPDAWRLMKRVEIDNIFVNEKHRGEGIGKSLINIVRDWAQKQHAKRIIVRAFTENTKALSFYQREGFSPYESILQLRLN